MEGLGPPLVALDAANPSEASEGVGIEPGFVGLALGLLALFSGSILVSMVLHSVLDLTSGRIMQAAVNLPPAEELGLE